MKNKVLIPAVAVGALAAFFSFKYISNPAEEDTTPASAQRKGVIVTTVLKAIQEGHYAPRELNDSFSSTVFHKLLDNLDYERKLFTQQEINQLKKDEFNIDDQIKEGNVAFFDNLNKLFLSSVTRADSLQRQLLRTPFSFTQDEKILLADDDMPWPADENALRDRWRQYLKYRTLAKYVDMKKDRDAAKAKKDSASGKLAVKTDMILESEARDGVRKNQEAYFKRLRKFDENERFSLFVNTIANSEDPHTDYFTPKTKADFDVQMSGSFVGIGASLKDEEGKVKIAAVLPGTPSWKQGELKAGDEITKVAQGAGEPLDIQGFDIADVVSKIRGKKGTEVRLTVKKVDGTVKIVSIIRDEVSIEETFAKSAIFKSPGGPVGYIYLPEFYADFNHMNGRRCADDVAREVLKLKESGVVGIILDLRNNGGGSLSDVVDMAGQFIDKGPVVQVKSTDAAPMTLRDSQPGTLYDGPMAVMVNGGSASASEIMAAAMQDYKRAIIVGTTTFGKGTVQKVLPLDEFMNPVDKIRMINEGSIGSLKLTVQKFYRINGGSTQLRGVVPDVMLPDPYSQLEMGERKDKVAIKWDEIPASGYKPVNAVNYAPVVAASNKRVASSGVFQLIAQSGERLKAKEKDNTASLNEMTYRKEQDEATALNKKLEDLQGKATPLPVVNPKDDLTRINADSSSVTKNATWLKNLQKDIYISETVNIINDMAKSTTKVTMGMGMK
jgi:carboxyl-terminal processing protease